MGDGRVRLGHAQAPGPRGLTGCARGDRHAHRRREPFHVATCERAGSLRVRCRRASGSGTQTGGGGEPAAGRRGARARDIRQRERPERHGGGDHAHGRRPGRARAGAGDRRGSRRAARGRRAGSHLRGGAAPGRVPPVRRRRGRAHPLPHGHGAVVRARRGPVRALRDAPARRPGTGRQIPDVRHARAGGDRAGRARGPPRRADGEPRRDRARGRRRRGARSRAPARVGVHASTGAPPRSASRARWARRSARP